MKKIFALMIAIIAAFGFTSCSNNEIVETNEGNKAKKIELNISVDDLNNETTTRAAKTGWVSGDKINMWFDDWNYTDQKENHTPDMVIKYNGSSWVVDSQIDGLEARLKTAGKFTVVYEGFNDLSKYTYEWNNHAENFKSKVSNSLSTNSEDTFHNSLVICSKGLSYTYTDNKLSASIDSWSFLTKFKVLIKNDDNKMNKAADKYYLQVKNVTTDQYATVRSPFVIIPNSDYPNINEGDATPSGICGGVQESDGIAFYYYSLIAENADIEFRLLEDGQNYEKNSDGLYYTATDKTVNSTRITNVAINHSKFAESSVIPDSKNTDKSIVLTVYDVTSKSAYFKGVFGDILPEGYTKTPPRGFMYSTEYSDAEDIYMYGKWVNPLKYKTVGDDDNVFRAYVSDLTPGATIYVIACVDYVNEVTYRYSPVTAIKTAVNTDYNGHEYVDLGLSVKWAKYNVGASSETEKGSYFSWGETTTKDNYSASYYKFYNGMAGNGWSQFTKYVTFVNNGPIDNIVCLEAEDDAARAVMGGTWRTPHDSELQELIDKCSWYHDADGVLVRGPNGNHLFLPMTGLLSGTYTYWENNGYYLGAEVQNQDNSQFCCLNFTSNFNSEKLINNSRTGGFVIRAVTE